MFDAGGDVVMNFVHVTAVVVEMGRVDGIVVIVRTGCDGGMCWGFAVKRMSCFWTDHRLDPFHQRPTTLECHPHRQTIDAAPVDVEVPETLFETYFFPILFSSLNLA